MKKAKKKSKKKSNRKNLYFLSAALGVLFLGIGTLAFFVFNPAHPLIWVVAGIIIALLIVMLFYIKKTGARPDPDYRALFILGLFFLAGYFINGLSTFFILGLVFIAMGLANKDKWGKQKKWNQLSSAQRKLKTIVMIVLGILILVGAVVFFFVRGMNGS